MNRILSMKDSDGKLGSAAVAIGEPHTSQNLEALIDKEIGYTFLCVGFFV